MISILIYFILMAFVFCVALYLNRDYKWITKDKLYTSWGDLNGELVAIVVVATLFWPISLIVFGIRFGFLALAKFITSYVPEKEPPNTKYKRDIDEIRKNRY